MSRLKQADNLWLYVGIMIIIGYIVIIFSSLAFAWPYQLNLTNGMLVDLNASNNATTNFTIYVITSSPPIIITNINVTNQIFNITNITWMNVTNITCINCSYNYSYVNIFNETWWNATNVSFFYNRTESDSRFLTATDFNNYKSSLSYPYVSSAEFNNLVSRVNNLNVTTTDKGHGLLYGLNIISILLAIGALYTAYMAGRQMQ